MKKYIIYLNRFKDDHDTTIGVEFGSKIIKVID